MKEYFLTLGILLFASTSVSGISISSDEWTGGRGHNLHVISKRQNSAESSSDSNSDSTASSEENDELWYNEQCIDHNEDCSKKSNQWSQRYWMTMKHYKPGGPIFMFLGGESAVSTWVRGGAWNHYAKHYKAATFIVEHRFYGQSFPTAKSDRSPEAMKILTSQQALKDYAQILTWFKTEKHKHLKDAKVVAFGGSYPGFLTAWFRALYKDLVNVAVASSAPMNYTFEFPEYIGKTSEVLQQNNPDCFNRIKSAFKCMEGIVLGDGCSPSKTNVTLDTLRKDTNLCVSLNTEIDKENFFVKGGRSVWASNNPGTTLLPAGAKCDILLNRSGRDIVKRYGKFIRKSNSTISCNRRRKRQSPADDKGGYLYSWYWQSCNEFVNFQVADPVYGMLGIKWGVNEEVYGCQYYYPAANFDEEKLRRNVKRTNEQYPPGKGYNGTCTIFTNGSWDPWGTKGMTSKSDTNDKNSVYYITNGEHMDDFFYPNLNSYANSSIVKTQEKVMRKIGIYLNSSDC